MSTPDQRAAWREQKRRQRGRDPQAKEKRRAYYEANKARICERQRRYYHERWKALEWQEWSGQRGTGGV